jgi:hypothetical protein
MSVGQPQLFRVLSKIPCLHAVSNTFPYDKMKTHDIRKRGAKIMSIWEMMNNWMAAATFWDWFWHIIAAVLALYFSVPQLWLPKVEKWWKNREEKKNQAEQTKLSDLAKPK